MAITDDVTEQLQVLLSPTLSEKRFRYFKSFRHFRRGAPQRQDYITINVVKPGADTYSINFYFGVRHDEVEATIARLKGRPKPDHYARTITQYSPNVGPDRHLRFPQVGSWYIEPPLESAEILTQVTSFIADLVLPWIDRHTDLSAVRDSLTNADGSSINVFPHEQVLTIDLLWNDREHVRKYLTIMSERLPKLVGERRREFQEFYRLVRGERPDLFPEFET